MFTRMGLLSFIKGDQRSVPGCANFDRSDNECLFEHDGSYTCRVAAGKRCGFFENAVLPAAASLGLGSLIANSYADKVGLVGFRPKLRSARRCQCGEVLQPRQRVCRKCVRDRQRLAYRRNQQKMRVCKLHSAVA
jgi:hypothetical protein